MHGRTKSKTLWYPCRIEMPPPVPVTQPKMVETFTQFRNEIFWLLCLLIVASAYGHEVLDRRDSDWRTKPAYRDCLLSVSHSQQLWRVFAVRQLVVPFCATATIAMEGMR